MTNHMRSMYHLYFFIASFIEEVCTSNEELRNILIDLRLNADRSMFDYVGDFTSEWSEYKSKYPNYVVSPDILIGRNLYIEPVDFKKKKQDIAKLLQIEFPEKVLISVILDYSHGKHTSEHWLDKMIDSVRDLKIVYFAPVFYV